MSDKPFLYALNTCPWCRKAKQYLDAHDVDYAFADVDLLPDEEGDRVVAEVQAKSGGRAFPVLVVGDEVIVGYNPERFARALGLERA
jgi:glutaredoxin